MLQIDHCSGVAYPRDNESWIPFHAAFAACAAGGGRPIAESVESCNSPAPGGCADWIANVADLWRTTGDIQVRGPTLV